MGLLDDFAGFIKTPEGQGLLSGVAGWAAGARKGTPWNNVGRGGLAGMMGYGNALEQQMQTGQAEQTKALRALQIKEATQKMADSDALRNFDFGQYYQSPATQSLAGGGAPTAENAAKIPLLAPKLDTQGLVGGMMASKSPALQQQALGMLAKEDELVALGDGGTLVNKRTGKIVAQNAKDPQLPWYVKQSPDGRTVIDPAYADFEKTKASFARPPAQPMAPVAYVDPTSGQTVWGTITDARGKPAANFNPMVAGQVAQAKGYGTETGKGQADAVSNLPKAIANGENAISQIEALRKHPGFGVAVGKSAMLGTQKIPGTDGYDFVNRLEQLKGGAFLTAFETLKGGGQITEVEGKKATAAIARMDNATSEKEFKSALDDYEKVIKTATNNAKMRAGKVKPAQAAGKGGSGEWSDL